VTEVYLPKPHERRIPQQNSAKKMEKDCEVSRGVIDKSVNAAPTAEPQTDKEEDQLDYELANTLGTRA
jgi:hypothetical protein